LIAEKFFSNSWGELHEYSAPGENAVCKIRILMGNSWMEDSWALSKLIWFFKDFFVSLQMQGKHYMNM
jgi:hypothetical protein